MAITRAQQARQMYKKGSKPVEQAGVMNYMPSEMVTVPKIAKSSPDTPTAKLAYITPEEQDILIDLNLYGSLDGKPNRGPGGIPSLEGDFGPDGKGNYSEEGTGRGVGPGSKDKDTSAFTDKGTGKYEVSTRPEDRQAVIDYSQGKLGFQKGKKPGFFTRPGSFKQKQQIYNIQQRLNAINRYTNARKNKIMAGLKELNLNPAYDEEDETFADLISQAPSITGMTDKFSDKTIADVLAGNRQIDFFSKIDPNVAPGLTTKGLVSIANLIGPPMGGPVTKEKLESLLGEINTLENINPVDTTTKDLMKEFAPNQYDMVYGTPEREGGGGIQDPCKGPNPPAYCFIGQSADENQETAVTRNLAGLTPRIGGGVFNFDNMADGGIAGMDREAFLLGGIAKGLKKAVRGVKKLAKSPIGKAAILGAIGFGIPGTQFSGIFGKGAGSFFGKGSFNPLKQLVSSDGFTGLGPSKFAQFLGKYGLADVSKMALTPKGAMAGIGLVSALAGLSAKPKDEDEFDIDAYYAANQLNPSQSIRGMGTEFDFYGGQRMRVADGGDVEPVAKKTMPLLDMNGKEKDYRETGGFVDMGRMERADDVPARLSKNEFVFTADAVRNAGEGDIDKGAEVMYNMMKNLEAGGEVSEESQGLEGARKMFQTSQRLEEVL